MSVENVNITPALDVTKIINKSLEMENGKITEKGWNDISKTIQMYSDKRYETARYLFVRDGKIIRHVAVSNQNPSSTISQPDKDFLFKLRTYAKQTDSSVVFVHNHPSGHVEPSQADIDTTNYIKNFFNIDDKNHFAGHIILDHGTFGLYEANQNKWFALINEKFHSMEEGKEYFSIQGSDIGIKQIRNKNDLIQLSEYAQKIDRTGDYNINEWIPAFFATHNGIVRTLDYINNDDFSVENTNLLQAHLKFVGRESGSNHVYFVPKTHQQKMLCEAFAQQTGIVKDVFYLKEDGSYELSKWSGGDIFSSITKEEIKMDDSSNYETINEEDKDIMEKKEQNPWFEKLSDIEKEAVLSDMRINPDLIGEYHSELAEANIDYKEYDRPSDEWFLNKINYKNLDGEFSYFNENNIGQQRHYAEVINEYKQELAAKQEINDEIMDVNDSLPETALEANLDRNINENEISNFDKELLDYKNGILGDSHIFNLGKPSEILQKCGFPPHDRIELASARLKLKSQQTNHRFDIEDIIGLDKALKSPIAVFEYGDKNKSQNVIVNLEKDGKNFLVGVFFNQKRDGFEVSSIRGLFNRDNIDWIRWIEQGKMIYGNKEKIQVSIDQQRTNLADVNNQDVRTSSDTYYLDSTNSILVKFGDVNDIFTKEFEFYKDQKERNEVFKKFRNYYAQNDSVEFDDAKFQSDEFYDALENKNIEILKRYTSFDDNYEISNLAREIFAEKANIEISNITTSNDLDKYINEYIYSNNILNEEKVIDANISQSDSKIEENNTESIATNFLLGKLNKAGIETIIDKAIYENMLAYVNEVNICLEMLEAEQYPVQMMGEKEKGSSLGAHLGNQQSSGRTLHHKYNISEQERQDMLNDFETKFDISSFSNDATSFLQQIKERFNLGVEKSDYAHINIDGQKYTIRVSDHGVNTNSVKENEIETSLVIQLPETKNNRFRNQNARAVKQFTYKGNTLTEERQRDILEGLHNYLKTGEFTGKLADDVRSTTAYELQQNLAEQMTLGGIKKGLMTGIALATMFCNMPKVAAETRLLNRDTYQETQIVQLENNIEIINFNDGSKAICNKGNKSDMMDIAIVLDKNNNPVACYNYDDYMKNLETLGLMEDASITSKSFNVSMDAKNYVAFVNDWQRAGTLSKAYGGGSITEINQQNYVNLLNAWLTGGYSEKAQFMIQDSLTYGFTLNNKIYLNPELVNSNTIAHEYTHLWDKYIQKENPTLWENGKEIFKQTSLWNEIINDENYKAISNNEDLILSECHSRICGKFAEEVLNKIALENGNEIKEEVIDWDKEVELFIEKEFGFKNPNYEITNEIDIKSQFAQENYNELKNFLSQPMKDLIAGKKIEIEQELTNNTYIPIEKIHTNLSELNEPTIDSIPVMPSIPEDSNTELSQVLKHIQEELALMKKENLELRKENEMLKGKLNNISSNQDIKEYGKNSYTEVTKDVGTSRTFNSQNAFTVNTPIPTFGHENENGELELIENAHFAHWEENKLDNSKNRVTLEYSTKQGEIKQIVMDEYDYRKMINACEELERNKNSVEMGSYEWILYHERYNKVMKTDQNKLRLNFASNFIHNYRIMCKLYASNPQEAVEQAKKLVDMMHPNERRAFNRMRKEAGKENFDNILLEEFKAHAQGIENKKSLLLNDNELLYDVNKDNLELKQGEQLGKSGKCVGDTVKMAFKFRNFDGKLVKTPKLDFKILKVTKNQNPDMAIVYNDEEKISYKIPLTDFMKHLKKVSKQQHKENAEQIKKDHKFYSYEGRS